MSGLSFPDPMPEAADSGGMSLPVSIMDPGPACPTNRPLHYRFPAARLRVFVRPVVILPIGPLPPVVREIPLPSRRPPV